MLTNKSGTVLSFAFDRTGTRLVYGSGNGKVGIVRAVEFGTANEPPKELFLEKNIGHVSFVGWGAGGCLWSQDDGFRCRRTDGTVAALAVPWARPAVVSSSGRYLALQEHRAPKPTVLILDTATLTQQWKFSLEGDEIYDLTFSPSENVLAVNAGSNLTLLDVANGKQLAQVGVSMNATNSIRWRESHTMAFNPRTGDLAVRTSNFDIIKVFRVPGARREAAKP